MRRLAWVLAGVAVSGCLDFEAPPQPVVPDTVGAQGCTAPGATDVGVPCRVCGPDGVLIACPFGCEDQVCAGVVDVQAGSHHACVLLVDGAVWCWGARDAAALGDGVLAVDEVPPVASQWLGPTDALLVGKDHTCVLSDGAVWCWGGNALGQVGQPPSPAVTMPTRVDLPLVATSLVRAHGKTTCATLADDRLWCWGFVVDGRKRGQAGSAVVATPFERTQVTRADGWAAAVGDSSACAYTHGEGLRCWGSGEFGGLGLGAPGDHVDPQEVATLTGVRLTTVDVGDQAACALDEAGVAWCWGANGAEQAGQPEADGDVVWAPTQLAVQLNEALTDVRLGRRHTCALGLSSRVFCWGLRVQGQTGSDFFSAQYKPSVVTQLPPAARIAAGGAFSCALGRDDGFVWCWGSNVRGTLGVRGLEVANTALPVIVGSVAE